MVDLTPPATQGEAVHQTTETKHGRATRDMARAIELRRRLCVSETRAGTCAQLLEEYEKLRDWRLVADVFGVSHRTMSRFVSDFRELAQGAAAARAAWSDHGLAGFNARRGSAS